ncbi:MAG TPA: TonB-dependent receptor plug domain-containing protein, partial [Parapedobacter sp.]|nr:TonB-dependent receptor plug domain-containing protein [Parapedobacter sp.]
MPVAAAFAQIRVTGTTTDGSTREKLLYIAIQIKGTTINTTSDMEGNYAIEVPDENAILVYTSVGYETLEVVVGNQTRIDVALSEDVALLDEVVVVGYGSQKKKELTGSVTGLKERDLNRGVQTSPMGMMQGRVAGLNISKPNSGDPNADYVFQLRGTSSLQGNTSPLIIIDGIPQGDLSAIPQDDIESIDILKDGSAAAIYGTRGTNGVILVTTKRGSIGKTSTSYSGYISTSSILNKLDMMSREEFLAN